MLSCSSRDHPDHLWQSTCATVCEFLAHLGLISANKAMNSYLFYDSLACVLDDIFIQTTSGTSGDHTPSMVAYTSCWQQQTIARATTIQRCFRRHYRRTLGGNIASPIFGVDNAEGVTTAPPAFGIGNAITASPMVGIANANRDIGTGTATRLASFQGKDDAAQTAPTNLHASSLPRVAPSVVLTRHRHHATWTRILVGRARSIDIQQ